MKKSVDWQYTKKQLFFTKLQSVIGYNTPVTPCHVPTTSLLRSLKKARAYWELDERGRNMFKIYVVGA